MIDLRDMQLLTALAHHRHFARAAEESGISQPAFSARIRKMEQALGTQIVRRGNKFIGFTAEGDVTLQWARRMLRSADAMSQDLQALRGALRGGLTLGVVPTALSHVAHLPAQLHAAHPGLTLRIVSATSTAILRGLEDYTMDAGVTYTGNDLPAGLQLTPLYDERYVLLCPVALAPRPSGTATWSEAATLPLCLLTDNMHNRQIIDATFASIGVTPEPVLETNALTAVLGQLATGFAATIVPSNMVRALPGHARAIALHLTDPEVAKPIGLVHHGFQPIPPALDALRTALMSVGTGG